MKVNRDTNVFSFHGCQASTAKLFRTVNSSKNECTYAATPCLQCSLIHVSCSLHHENTVENKLTFWPSLPGIPSFPSLPGTPWNHRILIFTSQLSQIWFGFIQNWLEPTGFPGKPGEPGDPALPFSPWKKHSLNTFRSWIDASVWDNLQDYHLTILSR